MNHPGRLFHGGVPGLRPGDVLTGGHQRKLRDDCPTCQARAQGVPLLEPLTEHGDQVYVTTHRLYAKHYASLYVVEPLDEILPSDNEDSIPSWRTPRALVTAVFDRAVLLTFTERRRLFREWGQADQEYAARKQLAGRSS